jgi:hypothetical protein
MFAPPTAIYTHSPGSKVLYLYAYSQDTKTKIVLYIYSEYIWNLLELNLLEKNGHVILIGT